MPFVVLPFLAVGLLLGAIETDAPPSGAGEGCMMGIPEETLALYKVECVEDEKGNLHELVFF